MKDATRVRKMMIRTNNKTDNMIGNSEEGGGGRFGGAIQEWGDEGESQFERRSDLADDIRALNYRQ